MLDARSKQRKYAKAFLAVNDGVTGKFVGYLLDLTTVGMRLKSSKAIETNVWFEFRMDLPEQIDEISAIVFKAKSKWSKKAEDSRCYETGFSILDCSPEDTAVIEALLAGNIFTTEAKKFQISLSLVEKSLS